jgi:hypothetical protein
MARWSDGLAEYMVQVSRSTAKNKDSDVKAAINPDNATAVLSQAMMARMKGKRHRKEWSMQEVRTLTTSHKRSTHSTSSL